MGNTDKSNSQEAGGDKQLTLPVDREKHYDNSKRNSCCGCNLRTCRPFSHGTDGASITCIAKQVTSGRMHFVIYMPHAGWNQLLTS